MNSLERIIQKTASMFSHHAEVPEDRIDVEQETLYLLRLAAIDADEKRFRQVQRDGRRAIKLGCE